MVTDCALQDGSVYAQATGGKAPYTFILNGVIQPDGNFEGIKAGVYTMIVRDYKGCEATTENIKVGAAGISFNTIVKENNSCLGSTGSITIDVTDGHPPFQYRREGGTFTDNNFFDNLAQGNYLLAIKDNFDCIYELNVNVPKGPTGVSWSTEILPIIQTSCAITRCHNGISRPDLRIYSNAKFYAAFIKSMTIDRSMPQEGTLTQAQIDLISCWVDDGALNN